MSEKSEEFAARIADLVAAFESAVSGTEWVTRRYPKKMEDENDNRYEVVTLTLQKGPTRLYLDPTGYDIPGWDGVADLYLMPTGEPYASLYFADDGWTIQSPFPSKAMPEAQPKAWGRANVGDESLREVMEAISDNALLSR